MWEIDMLQLLDLWDVIKVALPMLWVIRKFKLGNKWEILLKKVKAEELQDDVECWISAYFCFKDLYTYFVNVFI